VTYFTGHATFIPTGWQDRDGPTARSNFRTHHNAQRPGAYFNNPSAQVMEIGLEFVI
jgi:KUP system potassium uptake protein